MKVLAILLTVGLVAAAAKAPEGDAVFRISEEDDGAAAGFEHDQFWVDRDSNQIEGRFSYETPEGRELETRYSAGLNGFTAEGDHLPLPVEDTAEVAEARAAFMAYMIELMAEQDQEGGNVQVEKIDDVAGSMDLAEFDELNAFLDDDDDVEVIEASRKKRAPDARNGYYQRDEMESRGGMSGMVDFSHEDFEDQLAMPSGAMSYSGRIQPMRYYGAAKKSQMAAAAAATSRTGSVYPTDPYNFASTKFAAMPAPAASFFYRPPMPTGMTKSTAREKTVAMMPVKAPLNKYTVPASTYYPFQQKQQQQPTRVAAYMPAYMSMAAKRPIVIGYHTQFQHPYQPTSYAAKPKAQDKMPAKTVYSSSYKPQMKTVDRKFSATPVKKKVLTRMPYFSYSMPTKTNVQTKTKSMEDMYKNQMKQYSDYSIPMRPAHKQQQQTFSFRHGFHQPTMSQAHHSHYPVYPTTSAGSYQPSGFMAPGRIFRGNGLAIPLPGQASPPGVLPTVPIPGVSPKPIPQAPGNAPARPIPQAPGNAPDYYPAGTPAKPIPQVPVGHPGQYPVVPARPIPQAPVGHPGQYPVVPARPIPQAPGSVPAYPIPQAPVDDVVGGAHPHHPGHGPGSPGNRPQVEEPANSQHGSVPNIPEVDQPAAILF